MTAAATAGLAFVVDDVEGNRVLAQAYLERLGWKVRAYPDALAALEAVRKEVPQAMLVDVRMPGIGGEALASMLRGDAATRGIRIVGYTAHAVPQDIAALRAGGFDDVLVKPVLMADMARALPAPARE